MQGSTVLPPCNSILRIVAPIHDHDHRRMARIGALTRITITRRRRLKSLLADLGPAEVERKTGLAASYLRSMTKDRDKDKQARGITDEKAALIEERCGKPEGWLSGDDSNVSEEAATYRSFDAPLLRLAIVHVEARLGRLTRADAEHRADVILAAYDMLVAGQSEDAVSGFLAGTQFAPGSRATKAR